MRNFSLTEAQARPGIVYVYFDGEATRSNCRREPYAEYYRQATGVIETPVQRILRAAQDEKERQALTD